MRPPHESEHRRDEGPAGEEKLASEETLAGEDGLIDWLVRRMSSGSRWIGDDAAILPRGEWAVTMDCQVEGVHFISGLDAAAVARRLLAVNLSDLAAMGATPAFAFLALAAPRDFDHRRFFTALTEACDQVPLALAGGDLSSHSQVTAVLTLLGNRPKDRRWLRRTDAEAGEDLWLGGTVGESAAGLTLLEHGVTIKRRSIRVPDQLGLPDTLREQACRAIRRQLLPEPQLELGRWLGGCPTGAAIDVSDGLARDLHRLCSQSGVGAEIVLDHLPLADGHRRLARSIGRDWRDLALCGGEDYVLLFTLPPGIRPPVRLGCTRIGTISDRGVVVLEGGERKPLPVAGWDHLAG